jgi:hypothetical protein
VIFFFELLIFAFDVDQSLVLPLLARFSLIFGMCYLLELIF